jgi:hypothetical protein
VVWVCDEVYGEGEAMTLLGKGIWEGESDD